MAREYNIAERLINCASAMLDFVDTLPSTRVGNFIETEELIAIIGKSRVEN